MSELSRLLNSEMAGRGVREVAASARDHGHELSPGTVSKYLNGRHGRPSESTLEAFSDALGIDLQQLRRAAGLPAGEPDPYVPPREAARLTSRQREALDDLIQAIVTREERAGEPASTTSDPADPDQETEPQETPNEPQIPTMTRRKKRARFPEPHAATSQQHDPEGQE